MNLRKAGMIILKILLWLFLLLLCYCLIAIFLSYIGIRPEKVECVEKLEIYVLSNGIHLNIAIHRKDLDTPLLARLKTDPTIQYYSFGWGDREFYLNTPEWSDLKAGVAFRALLIPSEPAMHVSFYGERLDNWKKVLLCPKQMDAVSGYISNSFHWDDGGSLLHIEGSGYTSMDTFYKANGSYSLFKTSNNWVNIALKKGNVKTSIWSPFPFGVLHHLK